MLIWLQAVVTLIVVGECGRDVPGSLIKSLVALLGTTCFQVCCILFDGSPQRFVGDSHLPGNIAGHLGRQAVECTDVHIGLPLQAHLIARLAMRKGVATHKVQSVPIGQLRCSQSFELLRCRMQFEFGGEHLFHSCSIAQFHLEEKSMRYVKERGKETPCVNAGDSLPREVEVRSLSRLITLMFLLCVQEQYKYGISS